MKVNAWVPVVFCTGLALASGCREPHAATPPRQTLRMTTAFGPFTRLLIRDYRERFSGLDIQEVNTIDSNAAVHALERGDADFGLAYADAVFASYSTEGGVGRHSQIRGVSLLEPLPAYFVVRKDSDIRQASDIRGHRVAIPGGSLALSNWTLGSLVLNALGVQTDLVKSVPVQAGVEGLADGSFDALLLSGWLPQTTTALKGMLERARVVPVEGPAIEQLRREYPFIRSVTTPLVLYPGQEHPVVTVGMDVLVICQRDLDEALVHDAITELFLAYPRLSGVEATLRFLKLDEAPATLIPLHPGAVRYFRERELSR